MDIKTKKSLVYAGAIIALVEGIMLCLTIFGIVLGVFCILAFNKFNALNKLSEQEFNSALNNKVDFGWAIYVLIVCFPLGLLVFLPYVLTTKEN